MADKQFVNGMITKKPSEKAPWVKVKLSIKKEELITWLSEQEGDWVNINIVESKKDANKWYAEVDTWKPDPSKKAETVNIF